VTHHTHADTTLACSGCGQAFVFSAGEQELQQLRGIHRLPEYCRTCAQQLRGSGKSLAPAPDPAGATDPPTAPGRRARR
jgi:Probable zinc-ribbon domain